MALKNKLLKYNAFPRVFVLARVFCLASRHSAVRF